MDDIFDEMVAKLVAQKIGNPRLEARIILSEVCKKEPSEIYSTIKLSPTEIQKAQQMLENRLAHCPLDKIVGHREFYKYDFITNKNVLSPRPDTEILLESALTVLQKTSAKNVLDLGTGSGCIIISLLAELQNLHGVAIDISSSALAVAQQNAQKLNVAQRLKFLQTSWFEADFMTKFTNKFSAIVTNPPYIPTADIPLLDVEVKKYDPMLALDGGVDGFVSYKKIAELTPLLLEENGYIFIEAGINQATKIANIFTEQGLDLIDVVRDLAGVERCVILQNKLHK